MMLSFEGDCLISDHGVELLSRLNQLLLKNMFLDVSLVFRGVEIFAHKSVLSAASAVFCRKLSEIDENYARINLENDLQGIDFIADDIKLLIKYIYSGQVCVPQSRQSLFLRLLSLLEVIGSPSTANNYNFVSYPFSSVSTPECFDGIPNIQEDMSPFSSTYTYSLSALLSPDKYDNSIKPDKSNQNPFEIICSHEVNERAILEKELESSNHDLNLKQLVSIDPTTDYGAEVDTISDLQFVTDNCTSVESNFINNEPVKDMLDGLNPCILPGSTTSDSIISSFNIASSLAYSPLGNPDILLYTDDASPQELDFQSSKVSDSYNFPERHARLKVKDSIGGVSLQDTSQGEKNSESIQEVDSSFEHPFHSGSKTQLDERPMEDVGNNIQNSDGLKITCQKCFKNFLTENELINHLQTFHITEKQYKCKLCECEFNSELLLVQHSKNHLEGIEFICCICLKKFKTKATLKKHLSCHTSEECFKCTQCNSNYNQRSNLLKHLASQHRLNGDNLPITEKSQCSDCSFSSWAPHKVQQHEIRCHKTDKPFKCDQCTYTATEKASLIKHTRVHTKERPYSCSICGQSFTTLSSHKRHSRSHKQEKPHRCELCGKTYADRKRLKEHLLMHEDKKPVECPHCSYTCRRKDHLKEHFNRKHSELLTV